MTHGRLKFTAQRQESFLSKYLPRAVYHKAILCVCLTSFTMKPVQITIKQEALAFPWLLGSPEIIFASLQSEKSLSCLASIPPDQAPCSHYNHKAGRTTGQLVLFTHPFALFARLPWLTWHPRQSLQKEHASSMI